MTQNNSPSGPRLARGERRTESIRGPLSLHQISPAEWHRDRPAFAGDPYMDWESAPEGPEARWPRHETKPQRTAPN